MAKVGERLEAEIKADIEEWERRADRTADEQLHSSALDRTQSDAGSRQHSPSARLAALLPSLSLSIRVGIHSGGVMAGVIGRKLPRYRLFGDTVNTTARMCTNGAAGRVHVSPDTAAILSSSVVHPRLECIDHSTRSIKGKGLITTCWLRHDDEVLMQPCQPRSTNNIVTFAAPDIVTLNTVPEASDQQLSNASAGSKLVATLSGTAASTARPQSVTHLAHQQHQAAGRRHASIHLLSLQPLRRHAYLLSLTCRCQHTSTPWQGSVHAAWVSIRRRPSVVLRRSGTHRNTLLQREEANEWGDEMGGAGDSGTGSSSAGMGSPAAYRLSTRASRRVAPRMQLHKVSPSPRLQQKRKVSDGSSRMRAFTAAAAAGGETPAQHLSNSSPIVPLRSPNKPIARGRSVMLKPQRSPLGSTAALQRIGQSAIHARGHNSINAGQGGRRKKKDGRARMHADSENGELKSDSYSAEENTTGEESIEEEKEETDLLSQRDRYKPAELDTAAVSPPAVPHSPSSPIPPDSIIVTPSTPEQSIATLSHQHQPAITAVMEKVEEEERKEAETPSPIPPASPPVRTVSSPSRVSTILSQLPLINPSRAVTSVSAASSPKQLRLRPANRFGHHRARTLGQFKSFTPVSSQLDDTAGMGKRKLRKKYGSAGLQEPSPRASREGSSTVLPPKDAPTSPPAQSSSTVSYLSRTAEDEHQQATHPSPSAVSHHLSLPHTADDRISFSSQPGSQGSSFSSPGAGEGETRVSVTHSHSSRVFHVSEAMREKEYQKQRKVSAMMGTASPLNHSPLRVSHSRSLDRDSIVPLATPNGEYHNSIISTSGVLSQALLPDSLSLNTLPTLDTDDLPFHMLDPDTMKLGLDLSFVDYPDLERKYQQHQQSKIYDWLTFRLSVLILAFLILSVIDLTMRLTGASDPTLPALYGRDATNRFIIRVACGAIPCAVLIFAMNRSRSPRVLCMKQPFIRLFQHLSHAVLVLLCILSANLFLTDVLLPEPNIDSWCGVIVLCGLASSLFRLPSTHNLLFVTWSTFCYLLSFVMVPLVWTPLIVDGNQFSLGLVLQCVIFCVCMFCLFYVNSRVLEVRTRERYLTLLAIKKQRKDTSALLERLLPKTVITQLLEMGRRGTEDSALIRPGTAEGGGVTVGDEREMSAVQRVERQMSTTSQSGRDRRQSSSKAFSFPSKSIAPPHSPLSQPGERKRALSSSAVTPHPPHSARLGSMPTIPSIPSPQPSKTTIADHRRAPSSAAGLAPPLGAPSLLASFYPSVTVMQADVCSFTPLCARSTPQQVITMLNSLFLLFDSLTDQYAVYKVETIGDAVLAVCGAPTADTHHALRMCELSLAARDALRAFTPAHDSTPVRMRFGVHSGKVVGGVVGLKKMPRFHIYGQTVSTAGAMEQAAEPMTICMSADTWRSVKENDEWAVPKFDVRRIGRQQRPTTAGGNGSSSIKSGGTSSGGDDSHRSEDGSDDEDEADGGGGISKRLVMYELVSRKAMADEQEGQRMPARAG